MDRGLKKYGRFSLAASALLLLQTLPYLQSFCLAAADSGTGKEAEEKSDKTGTEKGDIKGTDLKGEALNPENINKILATEDVYGEQFKVSSFIQGNEITVQTWTNPKSRDPEHDYKINAVLIAKKLMDAFPESIRVCKVRYFERNDPEHKKYTEFTVVPGVVKSFAQGIMSEADLLTTIPMTYFGGDASSSNSGSSAIGTATADSAASSAASGSSGIVSASGSGSSAGSGTASGTGRTPSASGVTQVAALNPAVVKPVPLDPNAIVTVLPGIELTQRASLLDRIKSLEKKGVKSPLARQMFATMEEQVRDGREAEARTSLSRLSSSIESMEKNYEKAKTAKASGAGPITVRSGSPVSSSSGSGASSGGGAGGGGSDFETGLAIIKKKMGDWYPHYGPLYIDRYNIGNKLFTMQSGGTKVDQYRQQFLQMEATVIGGGSGLETAVRNFNQQLHLQEAVRDEEYKFQQKLADERKGMDLK